MLQSDSVGTERNIVNENINSMEGLSTSLIEQENISVNRTTNGMNLLGISNEGDDLLGAPVVDNLYGGSVKDILDWMAGADPGSVLYLNGGTYTAAAWNEHTLYSNVKDLTIIGGSQSTPNQMAKFIDGGYQFYFEGVLDNVKFYSLDFDGCFFWARGENGAMYNCLIENCRSASQFFCTQGYEDTNRQYPVINTTFKNSHHVYNPNLPGVDYTEFKDGHGQFGAVFGTLFENCNFINTSSTNHGGALCIADESEWGSHTVASTIRNTNFTDINSKWFAVYLHSQFKGHEDLHIRGVEVIENCNFINCAASEEYGACLGLSHDEVIVRNCNFINNTGGQGTAIMVGGLTNENNTIDDIAFNGYNTKGNNISIIDCYFENNFASKHPTKFVNSSGSSGSAGAIYVFGNNTLIKNSIFVNNSADNGNGSAILILGQNTNITNCQFYNHTSDNGTIFIVGNNTKVSNSRFENNTASENGAGIYIKGNNTLINHTLFSGHNATNGGAVYINGDNSKILNSTFNKNNVTRQGGAVFIEGSNSLFQDNRFVLNEAVPETDSYVDFTGLGGAVYVKGDNTNSIHNVYLNNTARNGSAIYTDGKNFKILNDWYDENQAWSYLLIVNATPAKSLYNESDVFITVLHIGGDNILNAVHNVAGSNEIWLENVTYRHSSGAMIQFNNTDYQHPTDADHSENGTIPYQEDREALQYITIEVYDKDGYRIAVAENLKTDIHGYVNMTVSKANLTKVGNYTVTGYHGKDWNYKEIGNFTKFQIFGNVDLSVNITSDKDEYFVGDTVIWTITVKNAANGTEATKVNLTDIISTELFKYISSNPSKGNYSNATNNWTIGSISPDETVTLIIESLALKPGTFNNNVNVTSFENDWNLTNNKNNKTVRIIDLGVNKTVNNQTPYVGDSLIYTLTIINAGEYDFERELKVVDDLPEGLVFDERIEYNNARLINQTVENRKITWYISNIPKGKNATIVIRVNVTKDGKLTNNLTIDDRLMDNETVTAVPSADLSINKTVSDSSALNGTDISWTITVKNNGPSKAVNVIANDVIPKGLILVEITRNDGISFENGVWTIGDMDNDDVRVLIIKTKINATNTTIVNRVNVTSDTYDPNLNNNNDTNQTFIPPEADIYINKKVSESVVRNGTTVYWTITVVNYGPDNATNVRVTDTIPEGLIFIGPVGKYNGTLDYDRVWTIKELPVNVPYVLTIETKINTTNTTLVNKVDAISDIYDPNLENNNASNQTKVLPEADLIITKSVSNSTTHNNTVITWTITVKNNGPDNATNVKVTDIIPKELYDITVTENEGNAFINGIWTIDEIPNGETRVLVFNTTVNATNKTIVNKVNVTSDIPDPDLDNNNASNQTYVPPEADIEIIKYVSVETARYGDIVYWGIIVTNKGQQTAENVVVKDFMPEELIYLEVDNKDYEGIFDENNYIWYLTTLNVNEPKSLILKTQVNATNTTIVNNVTVNSDTYDPDTSNNNASNSTYIPPEADLEVIITNDHETNITHIGDTVIWTINVTNHGPDEAINTILDDIIPKELIYVSDDSEGAYNNETGRWTIGYLPVSETVTLKITTVVNKTNTTITRYENVSSDIYDPNMDNNKDDSSVVIPPEADLQVTIINDHEGIITHIGDTVIWTINVTNNGPDDAINSILDDIIPKELIYVSDDSQGAYDNETGRWTIGNVTVGETVTLKITTVVNKSNTTITRYENVSSDTYDPKLENNKDDSSVDIPPEADLEVIITNDHETNITHIGDTVIWTINVTNHGPDDAINTILDDIIPKELIYVSDDSQGAYDNESGRWTIGDLPVGETVTLKITTVVNKSNTTITRFENVSSDIYDPNMDNNKDDSSVVIPPEADLEVTIINDHEGTTTHIGDTVVWTINVTNHGPDDAINTILDDIIPEGLIYVSDDSGGAYDNETGRWTIGDLPVDGSVTLKITTVVNKSNTTITRYENVSSDTYDPKMENNKDDSSVVIPPEADLEVIITNDHETNITHIGDTVIWTINVTNHGPDDALNTILDDIIPKELIYVSDDSQGAYDNETGRWTIGDLPVGETVTLKITTVVNKSNTTITRYENVSSDIYDPNMDNNKDDSSVVIPPEADLVVTITNDHETNITHIGDTVIWTINVTNHGPDDALNTILDDIIPKELI
ncbi:right-handed parallel beta-helix repeat-containing protein, partial [Methanobrevibacter sp.]|uniref:right-handed parallel beta-helix repeat-containing protein n=1 Tax=Methanobrevibacter sp. TaxID=66852 RepID=UPI00388E35C8